MLLVLAFLGGDGQAQQAAAPAGHWEGALQAPGGTVGLTVDLAPGPAGGWVGSLSIPAASAFDVPVNEITVQQAAVRFTAAGLPGHPLFNGNLTLNGTLLSGTADGGNGPVPFLLRRTGEANVKVTLANSPLPPEMEGTWQASLATGGQQLHLVLKLARAGDGTATGTLTSVDQGNTELPITTIQIEGKQVKFEIRAVSGVFTGTLEKNGNLKGQLSTGATSVPLTFQRTGKGKQ